MTQFPKARPSTGRRQPRKPAKVRTHVMIRGGQTDHRGEPICDECGHLRSHRIHDLREVTEVERATDARRLGER